MKRARSILLLFLGLIAVLCSLTAWTVYRERRQERLNRDLIAAVKRNDTKAVITLLNQGADANCHDEPYKPVPWGQILRDRLRGVKPKPSSALTPLLLALVQKGELNSGSNLISYAILTSHENVPLVRTLLVHQADVNFRDQFDTTPLVYAIQGRKKATTHLLLKYGADITDSHNFNRPLVFAMTAFPDSTDVLADMLQRGADVNQGLLAGETALWQAVNVQNVEAVRLLLSYHAFVTFQGRNFATPLAMAKRLSITPKSQQIIRLLQQAGAKDNQSGQSGQRATRRGGGLPHRVENAREGKSEAKARQF